MTPPERQPIAQESSSTPQRLRALGVIIDLDGTLLDTVADLAAATNSMLLDFDQAQVPLERVASYVGKGSEVLVHRALSGSLDGRVEPALAARALASFYRHYERENGRQAQVYPGIHEGLAMMRERGLRLACVTNKPQRFADSLLAATGLAAAFELVLGGDALPRRKPNPMPLLHVCERFAIAPERMVAIGDSVNDALAARAAGMPVLIVPYGYNEGRPAESIDADGVVASLAAAAELIAPAETL